MTAVTEAPKRKGPHPALFFLITLPYGTGFGFVGLALLVLGTQHRHIDQQEMNAVVALAFQVHAFKLFWAPVVDSTMGRKRWYLFGLAVTVAGTIAASSMPFSSGHLGALAFVVVISQVGLSIIGMACEGLLALAVPENEKGRCSGWFQAGSFFGNGIGGWLALKLATSLSSGVLVGVILGGTMLLSVPGLFLMPAIAKEEHARSPVRAVIDLFWDLFKIVTSKSGLTGLIICLSPVGAGALGGVMNAIAEKWGVGPDYHAHFLGFNLDQDDMLGFFGGVLGGLCQVGGALAGGALADKMNRRLAYAVGGGVTALAALGMAIAPKTPVAFVVGGLFYALANGLAYAAFTGFVIETIGKGAAATKYNMFAALANQAVSYMIKLDSWGAKKWGATGACLADAGFTFGGILLLVVMVTALRPAKAAPAAP